MRVGGQLMLRRALAITVIAVALSAAGALAFAPGLARVGRAWPHAVVWSALGLKAIPSPLDSAASTRDPSLDNQGGVPGTYCEVRPHDPNMTTAASPDQRLSTEPAMSSSATTPPPGKTDLLTAPAMCNVTPPVTTHATPAQPPILP